MPSPPPANTPTPWLDRLPARIALPAAIAVGLAVGWGLWALPLALAVPLFLIALAVGVGLALQGQPLLAPEPEPRARPRPARRRRALVPDDWWVPIPAGEFRMGSTDGEPGRHSDEGPQHSVHISAFECLRFPVTRGLVRRAEGRVFGRNDRYPQVSVSWLDAVRLCNRFSKADGRTPCYGIDGDQVRWDRNADGWRLLTEAEWEYACRAGTTTRWSFGDDEARLGEHVWYVANARGKLQRVGKKRPNPRGLHDMHGLVWEWCWDWYGPYDDGYAVDPVGPASGASRALRGGAFGNWARGLRSAFRLWNRPEDRGRLIGFRCARAPRRHP